MAIVPRFRMDRLFLSLHFKNTNSNRHAIAATVDVATSAAGRPEAPA